MPLCTAGSAGPVMEGEAEIPSCHVWALYRDSRAKMDPETELWVSRAVSRTGRSVMRASKDVYPHAHTGGQQSAPVRVGSDA